MGSRAGENSNAMEGDGGNNLGEAVMEVLLEFQVKNVFLKLIIPYVATLSPDK